MGGFWQDATIRKLALTAFGMGIILATATPQTAERACAFLAGQGYTQIALQPAKPWHGRGQKRFPFEARSAAGTRVSGEVRLGSFAWFYSVRLDDTAR